MRSIRIDYRDAETHSRCGFWLSEIRHNMERMSEAWQSDNSTAKCVKLREGHRLRKEGGWSCGRNFKEENGKTGSKRLRESLKGREREGKGRGGHCGFVWGRGRVVSCRIQKRGKICK